VFWQSGSGKLQNLERVIAFFTELGIPSPELQAPFVAGVELVGGALLMIGLATRIASIPLAIVMCVALATAVEWEGFTGLIFTDEFAYLAVFVWLLVAGPGAASLDALIKRFFAGRVER
jgi:putative oxidoreductase